MRTGPKNTKRRLGSESFNAPATIQAASNNIQANWIGKNLGKDFQSTHVREPASPKARRIRSDDGDGRGRRCWTVGLGSLIFFLGSFYA
jgi:hypothetical protein